MNAATAAMYARRSAHSLLQTVWIDRGFPVDPAWIAGKLGVTVIETELPGTVLGSLVKDQNKDPVIIINQLDDQGHKRFNCAHKIGHFADHQLHQDDFYKHLALRDEHSSTDPKEVFAHRFSQELLMPEDEIHRLESEGASDEVMARHFGVPVELMRIRIADTRLCA
ncbi:MAG: ImmA/IrrE family metallo-endopeptidase [Burkholderiaceae bacterium]